MVVDSHMRQNSAPTAVAVDILLAVEEHYNQFHQEADWQQVLRQAVAAGYFSQLNKQSRVGKVCRVEWAAKQGLETAYTHDPSKREI